MSEAREKYYMEMNDEFTVVDKITAGNYSDELEQDLEFACKVSRGRAEEILKLESEKAELIELLSDIAHFTKIESKKVQCYPAWWHRMEDLLKKHRVEI